MKKILTMILVTAAAASGAMAQTSPPFAPLTTDIIAPKGNAGYVIDARGVVARDPYGLCWHTGSYTKADAIPGCDLPMCVAPDTLENGKCVSPPAPVAPVVTPVAPVTPPPVVAPAASSEKVSFAADALFDFDKAVLKPEGKAKLDDLASKLSTINLEVIIAVGHTDSKGTDAYNEKLAMRRAESVKAYLQGKGVEANRIYTEGKGEKQPVADNKTDAGRAQNRRVEIEVVGTRK
jgi:OOP family OmpA-OmpF porin